MLPPLPAPLPKEPVPRLAAPRWLELQALELLPWARNALEGDGAGVLERFEEGLHVEADDAAAAACGGRDQLEAAAPWVGTVDRVAALAVVVGRVQSEVALGEPVRGTELEAAGRVVAPGAGLAPVQS